MNILKKIFLRKGNEKLTGSIEYAIVGLGNPGKKYENTRHNAGFIAVDYISKELGITLKSFKFQALCEICELSGKKVIILKPQTFMNLSGESVKEVMSFYKIPAEKVIIIFDDISLPVGKMRIRKSGSPGGQNGIKNIIQVCGTDKFPRIKIGIGQKPNAEWELANWVLSQFTVEDRRCLDIVVENVKNAVELILQGDIEKAMNNYN